ncbi:MAG: DUF624 domain-containing protein [Lachnospiraceae bacterium]|nr:DUF624 domain-containing protein [Lachnospiraceae bacterium]
MAGKMMDFDGPLVRFTEKAFGLIWLNILTIVCSLPVITFGASFAALNTVVLKMSKDQEGYITKEFFKAFKINIKIGIKASIAILLFVAVALADFYAISLLDVWFADVAWFLLILFVIFFVITVTFLFPIMAKFDAGFVDTVKNSFKFGASHILKTVLMFLLNIFFWVISYYFLFLSPLLFICGFSLPAYIGTGLYKEEFVKIEKAHSSADNKES